jgi:DeoR/GlpR family transcriptional regulator of sugar metabolism
MHFTIFSNNPGVTVEMENTSAVLIMIPGTYDPATNVLTGPLTMEMIRQVNATKVFLGAHGLSLILVSEERINMSLSASTAPI